ncbi:MAG: hypothetical protein D6714_06625 [Bacteroidetes bacterium]|nr:MAG: hypothetical protein D6714_06625 [Bacteroidota bacterium]
MHVTKKPLNEVIPARISTPFWGERGRMTKNGCSGIAKSLFFEKNKIDVTGFLCLSFHQIICQEAKKG